MSKKIYLPTYLQCTYSNYHFSTKTYLTGHMWKHQRTYCENHFTTRPYLTGHRCRHQGTYCDDHTELEPIWQDLCVGTSAPTVGVM